MREIKFRAWKESEQRMVDWEELLNHPYLKGAFERTYLHDIMQYTGLKDKNGGKEIYEGDIVRWADTEGTVYIKAVTYNIESLSFQIGNISYSNLSASGYFQTKLEVIGNIYENKELLNANP